VDLNREKFLRVLSTIRNLERLVELKEATVALTNTISQLASDEAGILLDNGDENSFSVRKDVLVSELEQVIEAQTIARSKYYIERLIKRHSKGQNGQNQRHKPVTMERI